MKRPLSTLALCLAVSLGEAAAPTLALAQSPEEIRAVATDAHSLSFYQANGWKDAWNRRRAESLRAALRDAGRHGIDATRLLEKIDAAKSPAAEEAALTSAALTYAEALAFGIVDPDKLFSLYTLDRPTADLNAGLARALDRGDVRRWLEGLAPQDAEYKALSKAYVAEAAAGSPKARQLAVNLERRRWLARAVAPRRIDVNTAATFLDYYKGGDIARRLRTVTGKPATPTPQLGSMLTRLVVNPPWNVPTGIAKKEILPKGRAYLKANDMYIENGRVVQRPGPKSALGIVKFDLDNPYAIYLHDTPSKSFFNSDERHRSHGCVRVQDAEAFARQLAEEDGVVAEFNEELASGETATVNISDMPVRLLYHTAYLDEAGRVAFVADDYRWDEKVAKALSLTKGAAAPIG